MVTKAHQKPSYEPFVKDRGNSSSLKNVSCNEKINVLEQCYTVSHLYIVVFTTNSTFLNVHQIKLLELIGKYIMI